MKHDSIGVLVGLIVGAGLISACAVGLLWSVSSSMDEQQATLRRADEVAAAESLQDAIRKTPEFEEARIEAMGKRGMIWRPSKGVVWPREVPAELKEIHAMRQWKDWSAGGMPPRRGVRKTGAQFLMYARVGEAMYGTLSEEDPVAARKRVAIWPIGLVAVGGVMGLVALLAVRLWMRLQKVRELNLMQTDFISNASHELKTPLAGIALWCGLLKKGQVKDLQQAYETIDAANAHEMCVVENLLCASRRKPRALVREETDIVPLIHATVRLLQIPNPLTLNLPEKFLLSTDAQAFRQILFNLLSNAVKYAPDAAIAISLSEQALVVADGGPGLSPDALKRVFERFYRADNCATAPSGLGLGLAISHDLAAALGWQLTAANGISSGAVFTLSWRS